MHHVFEQKTPLGGGLLETGNPDADARGVIATSNRQPAAWDEKTSPLASDACSRAAETVRGLALEMSRARETCPILHSAGMPVSTAMGSTPLS